MEDLAKDRTEPFLVLVVGKMKNHEANIVQPIIDALTKADAKVVRTGGYSDFFEIGFRDKIVQDWARSVPGAFMHHPAQLHQYKAVLFVDSWNYALPLFLFQSYAANFYNTNRPKFYGICQGSTLFDNDVAREIPRAVEYESFLLQAYDGLFVHSGWMCKMLHEQFGLADRSSLRLTPFPYDRQIERARPSPSIEEAERPPKRIIFAHRWSDDKDREGFTRFIAACCEAKKDYEFIICDQAALYDESLRSVLMTYSPRFKITEWLIQDELMKLCSEGGYAWASAKSEIAAYAVHDLISYGLHPLVSNHAAYAHFPPTNRFNTYQQAIDIVERGMMLSNPVWEGIMSKHIGSAERIAANILELRNDSYPDRKLQPQDKFKGFVSRFSE